MPQGVAFFPDRGLRKGLRFVAKTLLRCEGFAGQLADFGGRYETEEKRNRLRKGLRFISISRLRKGLRSPTSKKSPPLKGGGFSGRGGPAKRGPLGDSLLGDKAERAIGEFEDFLRFLEFCQMSPDDIFPEVKGLSQVGDREGTIPESNEDLLVDGEGLGELLNVPEVGGGDDNRGIGDSEGDTEGG